MKQIILLFSISLICALNAFTQTSQTNSLDKINLSFRLEADPSVKDVGFDNPKSYWKVKYEIFVADFAELEKIGKCGYVEGRSIKNCSNNTDKKLDKKIRKMAQLVKKGKFSTNQLEKDENRNPLKIIELSPQAIAVFREAKKNSDKNPVLITYISSKISTKNSSGAKLKKKYETEGFNWWKTYKSDKTIEFRNFEKVTYHLVLQKSEDGSLQLNVGYIHIG